MSASRSRFFDEDDEDDGDDLETQVPVLSDAVVPPSPAHPALLHVPETPVAASPAGRPLPGSSGGGRRTLNDALGELLAQPMPAKRPRMLTWSEDEVEDREADCDVPMAAAPQGSAPRVHGPPTALPLSLQVQLVKQQARRAMVASEWDEDGGGPGAATANIAPLDDIESVSAQSRTSTGFVGHAGPLAALAMVADDDVEDDSASVLGGGVPATQESEDVIEPASQSMMDRLSKLNEECFAGALGEDNHFADVGTGHAPPVTPAKAVTRPGVSRNFVPAALDLSTQFRRLQASPNRMPEGRMVVHVLAEAERSMSAHGPYMVWGRQLSCTLEQGQAARRAFVHVSFPPGVQRVNRIRVGNVITVSTPWQFVDLSQRHGSKWEQFTGVVLTWSSNAKPREATAEERAQCDADAASETYVAWQRHLALCEASASAIPGLV